MSKIDGGVYIASPNGLRGDIIPIHHHTDNLRSPQPPKKYVVRLRGSNGTEIPVDDHELVEYTKNHAPESTREEEDVRFHLSQKAQQDSGEFYIEERMLAMELGDEFTYMLVSNSRENEESSPTDVLPPDIEGEMLVRLLEGYFVGQGMVVANGRHLHTFSRALSPFWREDEQQVGSFSHLTGTTSGEIFEQLSDIFDHAVVDGLVLFRAFCYAHHRLDYHQQDHQDALLDAYCVAFYVIKLLQGMVPGKQQTDFAALVDRELNAFGSDIEMTVDDLVWCFCILFLRIGTDIRRYKGLQAYNRIFPRPYDLCMNEELFVCQLAMELRPDSPVSFLPAYRMVMETKSLVPRPFQNDWMRTAHGFAERGLEAADRLGDPYFQYMFEMLMAYWVPTTINEPNPYTLGQIESRINLANDLKKECTKLVPRYMFWMGEKHELSLRQMLKCHPIDSDVELTVALIDAFSYTSLHLSQQSEQPKNGHLVFPSKSDQACAHCSKQVKRRLQCARCKKIQYCSKECQVAHWKEGGHRIACVPITPK